MGHNSTHDAPSRERSRPTGPAKRGHHREAGETREGGSPGDDEEVGVPATAAGQTEGRRRCSEGEKARGREWLGGCGVCPVSRESDPQDRRSSWAKHFK